MVEDDRQCEETRRCCLGVSLEGSCWMYTWIFSGKSFCRDLMSNHSCSVVPNRHQSTKRSTSLLNPHEMLRWAGPLTELCRMWFILCVCACCVWMCDVFRIVYCTAAECWRWWYPALISGDSLRTECLRCLGPVAILDSRFPVAAYSFTVNRG